MTHFGPRDSRPRRSSELPDNDPVLTTRFPEEHVKA